MAAVQSSPADDRLWCLECQGPDEISAAPDRATAMRWAAAYTLWWLATNPVPHPYDPVITHAVAEWPGSAESHAIDLAKSEAMHNRFADLWLPADWHQRRGAPAVKVIRHG